MCTSGEDWNGLMHDCMGRKSQSCNKAEGGCGSPLLALIYFLSFVYVASFVLMNLVIAAILENFAESRMPDELLTKVPM